MQTTTDAEASAVAPVGPRQKMSPEGRRRGLGGLATASILTMLLAACAPPSNSDQAAIAALMNERWNRPDAPLEAGPIVVVGDSAVADWTQGQAGGRALLERRAGQWRIVLCAGDALRTERGLTEAGLHPALASGLAAKLAQAEGGVSPKRLSAMAAFQTVVPMGVAP